MQETASEMTAKVVEVRTDRAGLGARLQQHVGDPGQGCAGAGDDELVLLGLVQLVLRERERG